MSVSLKQESDRPHVAHLRIDFNELNLFSVKNFDELRESIEAVPEEVSVLTITATQDDTARDSVRGISAGLNVEWAEDLSPHEGQALIESIYRMNRSIRDIEAVTVCGCGDYAIGGGFELALSCDFRIATSDGQLGLPEVDMGIPTVVQGGLLVRYVGIQTARELIYTGETISGDRALSLELVNRAVDAWSYEEELNDFVDTLATKSPLTLKIQKRVMKRFRPEGLESGMHATIGDAGRAFGSHDQQEAMQAFQENRDPEFQGK
jgi:enoyl-CoA hydratase